MEWVRVKISVTAKLVHIWSLLNCIWVQNRWSNNSVPPNRIWRRLGRTGGWIGITSHTDGGTHDDRLVKAAHFNLIVAMQWSRSKLQRLKSSSNVIIAQKGGLAEFETVRRTWMRNHGARGWSLHESAGSDNMSWARDEGWKRNLVIRAWSSRPRVVPRSPYCGPLCYSSSLLTGRTKCVS